MKRNIEDYIKPGAHAHLVGIGGVSMAPLAEVLRGKGVEITGSDGGGGVRHPHRRRS